MVDSMAKVGEGGDGGQFVDGGEGRLNEERGGKGDAGEVDQDFERQYEESAIAGRSV